MNCFFLGNTFPSFLAGLQMCHCMVSPKHMTVAVVLQLDHVDIGFWFDICKYMVWSRRHKRLENWNNSKQPTISFQISFILHQLQFRYHWLGFLQQLFYNCASFSPFSHHQSATHWFFRHKAARYLSSEAVISRRHYRFFPSLDRVKDMGRDWSWTKIVARSSSDVTTVSKFAIHIIFVYSWHRCRDRSLIHFCLEQGAQSYSCHK